MWIQIITNNLEDFAWILIEPVLHQESAFCLMQRLFHVLQRWWQSWLKSAMLQVGWVLVVIQNGVWRVNHFGPRIMAPVKLWFALEYVPDIEFLDLLVNSIIVILFANLRVYNIEAWIRFLNTGLV